MTPSTLAQWHDRAGSYRSEPEFSTGRPRRLPRRESVEGALLAARIRQATGSHNVRSLA